MGGITRRPDQNGDSGTIPEQLENQAVSSIVAVAPGSHRRALTETERNWLCAAAIVVGSIAAFGVLYGLEMAAGRWDSGIRLVLNPSETATRYLGISHFLVATLFLATSRRMRGIRPWGSFAVMLGVGALLCLAYGRIKLVSPLLASVFFFAYFLLHSLRDDVFFYFANGDAPSTRDPDSLREILRWSPFAVIGIAATLLAGIFGLGLAHSAWLTEALVAVPTPMRWALASLLPILALVAVARVAGRWSRAADGGAASFFRLNRPIYLVFAGTLLILVAQRLYSIVILHVAAWYVFSLRQLKKRPPPDPAPRPWSWTWVRTTPAGFRWLHIGSAVLLLAAGVVWAYGFRNNPALTPFAILLDTNAFPYWTILHVSVSFSH